MIVPEIAGFGYHDLKHKDELILKGEKAIRKIINKIMKKI